MADIEHEWFATGSPTAPVIMEGSFRPIQGVYTKARGSTPKIGVIATHHGSDCSDHHLAAPLAERGLGWLGFGTRYRGHERDFDLGHSLVDIGVGVRWLREEAGCDTVVVLGDAGAGSLMVTYQHVATDPGAIRLEEIAPSSGVALLGRRGPASTLPDAIADLPPADLLVTVNSHLGRADAWTMWADPSITDENDMFSMDPELDMYNPDNGPPYSPEFIVRYRQAQIDRNHRITAWVKDEIERLAPRGISNRGFLVHRTLADLRFLDLSIDPSERTVGSAIGDPRPGNMSGFHMASYCTLRLWLSMYSLQDSQCRAGDRLPHLKVPSLVVQATADRGIFPSDAQAYYDGLGADDKTLHWLPGSHFPDGPGSLAERADLIASWCTERSA